MKTLMAKFTTETTLLIPRVKGKLNDEGQLKDVETKSVLLSFMDALADLIKNANSVK